MLRLASGPPLRSRTRPDELVEVGLEGRPSIRPQPQHSHLIAAKNAAAKARRAALAALGALS